jgi:hypothetical protein
MALNKTQRRLMLAPISKHESDEYQGRAYRQKEHSEERCRHRLLSVVPIVSVVVEGGYAGRCLLCGVVGPVRGNGRTARVALLEQEMRHRK